MTGLDSHLVASGSASQPDDDDKDDAGRCLAISCAWPWDPPRKDASCAPRNKLWWWGRERERAEPQSFTGWRRGDDWGNRQMPAATYNCIGRFTFLPGKTVLAVASRSRFLQGPRAKAVAVQNMNGTRTVPHVIHPFSARPPVLRWNHWVDGGEAG